MDYNSSKAINQSLLKFIDPEQGGSPAKFKDALENRDRDEIESKSLRLGTLIHKYMLESGRFMSLSTKGMTAKGIQMSEMLWQNNEFDLKEGVVTIDEVLSDDDLLADMVQEFSYGRGKLATKIESLKKEASGYLNQRLENRNKILVNDGELKTIMDCSSSLLKNEATKYWLGNLKSPNLQVFDELEVFWEYYISGELVKLKSKIDRLIIDHESKTWTIVDLKTTGKPVDLFLRSVIEFRYPRQLAFYSDAADYYIKNELQLEGYTQKDTVYIIAVETFGLNESRVFSFSVKSLEWSRKEYVELLSRIQWHRNTNEWEYPKGLEQNGPHKGVYHVKFQQPHE